MYFVFPRIRLDFFKKKIIPAKRGNYFSPAVAKNITVKEKAIRQGGPLNRRYTFYKSFLEKNIFKEGRSFVAKWKPTEYIVCFVKPVMKNMLRKRLKPRDLP
jgi:hypothetical protein